MDTNSAKQGKETPELTRCLETLRSLQNKFEKRGIEHVAIFGSVARGEANEKSDLDIVITIKPGGGFGLFAITGLEEELAEIFGRKVDVISYGGLKSPKHDHVKKQMVTAF